ncbi:CgeB family protein [Pseudalkalibacillus caeni]|uniref:Spore maturation protein n=1 Tax=Exobacillus caeni TaxID=2574798 RepID=A0A5R9F8P6_9BACL|nr:glycosyltransferase [Pseudalkalibacillus caeni]TLS36894.1 spore maturation protein [Pseudalkalibacillus caeni]
MRLLYITSGIDSLSYLDPNIVSSFKALEKQDPNFRVEIFKSDKMHPTMLIRKVSFFKPDIIITLRAAKLKKEIVERLKKFGIPIGIWLVDDPYNITNHIRKAAPYDFVITQESSCVSAYNQANIKAIYLPLAVNPNFYHPIKDVPAKYKHDICFVGTGLKNRIKLFDELTPFLQNLDFIIIGPKWDSLTNYNLLKAGIIKKSISPTEVAKYYNGAKIVLNIHRDLNDINRNPELIPANTPNNRTFDIAACQAFQLADYRADIVNLYNIDKELITFSSVSDLKNKIDYYLKNDKLRNEIALNGYRRTKANHTYTIRMKELVQLLKSQIIKQKKI